jgi:hypothetical protein
MATAVVILSRGVDIVWLWYGNSTKSSTKMQGSSRGYGVVILPRVLPRCRDRLVVMVW